MPLHCRLYHNKQFFGSVMYFTVMTTTFCFVDEVQLVSFKLVESNNQLARLNGFNTEMLDNC